ncbi:MAG: hypothetical protein ABSF99_01715 [Anaerolineales bacterium]
MPQKLNLENVAPWKQRYRAPSIGSAQIAAACPTRAMGDAPEFIKIRHLETA